MVVGKYYILYGIVYISWRGGVGTLKKVGLEATGLTFIVIKKGHYCYCNHITASLVPKEL